MNEYYFDLEKLNNEEVLNFVVQQQGAGRKYAERQRKAKETKRKYRLKCTKKYVTFYIKDAELLKVANNINFQKFVKYHLQQIVNKNKGQ